MNYFAFAFAFACLVGCGSSSSEPAPPASPDASAPADASEVPTGGPCNGNIASAPLAEGIHVPEGSAIEWATNPPTSGPHYAMWAKWDRRYAQLPRGNWVHNLEHGGIVFAYRCDSGCDVASKLAALVNSLPDDPRCMAPVRHRAIVVADPLLPKDGDVTAIAWGSYYTATCYDEAALKAFYTTRVGLGPEDICTDGSGAYGGDPL